MTQPVDVAVLDAVVEMTGGDRAFLAELIDAYVRDAPAQLAALHSALAAVQPEAAVLPAHTLKSSSASLGAMRLADMCRDIEEKARAGAVDAGVFEPLAGEFSAVEAALVAVRDRST